MKRLLVTTTLLIVVLLPAVLTAQGNFANSLHATRQGKATFYSKANGGFELLTAVPMDSLSCQKCHAQNYADGTPVDPATYEPACKDCHAVIGDKPAQQVCLGCHSRQGAEIKLSGMKPIFTDVHRDRGMVCTDCHTKREMHGDETQSYISMLDTGAMDVSCENEGCHPAADLPSNVAHEQHLEDLDCAACHAQTVETCFNCHFESELQADIKRFYGPPPTGGFALLVRRPDNGKITTGTFMALTYAGKSFYTISRFNGHTISAKGRDCVDCHNNANVAAYMQTGNIALTKWNESENRVEFVQGVVPVPPDWSTAFQVDFVDYTGEVTDPVQPFDPGKWKFLKSGADTSQMLFAEPLTAEQIQKLAKAMPSLEAFRASLHGSRRGKATWYSKDNGGFETLTGVPIDSLTCLGCHAPNYPDGTPVDAASYSPGCKDCHAVIGDKPTPQVCLGCHSRQGVEIKLAQNPNLAPIFSDVHRDEQGMVCTDCHSAEEMHGTGGQPASMLEPGAMQTACTNSGCHPQDQLPANTAHSIHLDDVYCTACHAKGVVSCYNCHFESEVEAGIKRFYGPPPLNGFVLLVNGAKQNKVTTATFMTMKYGDRTFYAVGAFGPHTIGKKEEARKCQDCHDTDIIRNYKANGTIPLVQWNASQAKLVNTKGVIPVPPDWKQAFQLDFVDYTGQPTDPVDSPFDPTKWTFLKSGADTSQMLFGAPLTEEQMTRLELSVTSIDVEPGTVPQDYRLEQNYPNPFNPATTIEFALPKATTVSLEIFDLQGRRVRSLLHRKALRPGVYRMHVDAGDLSSGVYVYRITTPEFVKSRKMTVVK